MGDGPLPDFRKPPVIETVLSVQFAPIKEWGIPHLGLFWEAIRKDFSRFEVHPPIQSDVETFDPPEVVQGPGIRIEVGAMPESRCRYVGDDKHSILQLQNGLFVFNWKKDSLDDEYPKYEQFVRPSFEKYWNQFLAFLKDEDLEEPKAVQCEVTYVNHIPKGEAWDDVGDWSTVFNFLSFPSEMNFLSVPESANIDLAYLIPEKRGRLRAKIRRAIRISDRCDVIALHLIARGRPESSALDGIVDWFELGHEWVVRGFTELTTKKMHQIWERVK